MGITYKASDLVTAAMKLADLENTSFISSTENRMYINNAWEEIYQKAINIGEQYFLEEADLDIGENDLPEDFYQLYDIRDINNNPIKRWNKNCLKNERYYRIYKDKIYINGKPKDVKMTYYPAPQALDITGEGDVDLPFPNNIYKMLLVYKLAEYYKIRQNGDVSGIEALMENAWNVFYDTIERDDNENLVINDVVHDNHWFTYQN